MSAEPAEGPWRPRLRQRSPRAEAAPGPACDRRSSPRPEAERSAPAGPSGSGEPVSPRRGAAGGAEPEPGEKKEEPEATGVASSRPKAGGAQRKRAQRSPSRERISPCKRSCGKDQAPTGSDSAPRPFSSGPRARHHWWRRWSLKGTTCRKSLPPFHEDIAELSKSIDPELPEVERLSKLLTLSFEFSAQKLEKAAVEGDGFDPAAFRANVNSVSEELQQHLKKLQLDGTLKNWVEEEDPEETSMDPALGESVAQIKEHMGRFTTELQSWDLLLLEYQQTAENMSRRLEECKLKGGNVEPESYLGSSQAEVVLSKPDYQKILDDQREVFTCMELVLDEMLQVGQLLRAIVDTGTESLQNVSGTLAARTFRRMERSPVRRLLAPSAVAPSVAPSAGPSVAAPSASPSAVAPSAAAPPDA
ncbi:kinetochore-associated protein DSN1 homolog [Nothoprocta perdicaria]|uniref:kinetochore-associated protein DSN1 homolog n=1 Tax=Nothoprocta perdicaria TaxID=30464 RepID=UPI000E1BB164|nr:kinetochore-associated protein DSN1 homolog [Nothoprocta perdicaria]